MLIQRRDLIELEMTCILIYNLVTSNVHYQVPTMRKSILMNPKKSIGPPTLSTTSVPKIYPLESWTAENV